MIRSTLAISFALVVTLVAPDAFAQQRIAPPAQSAQDRASPPQACGTRDPRRFPQDCAGRVVPGPTNATGPASAAPTARSGLTAPVQVTCANVARLARQATVISQRYEDDDWADIEIRTLGLPAGSTVFGSPVVEFEHVEEDGEDGWFDSYTLTLAGAYPAIRAAALRANGISACQNNLADSCALPAVNGYSQRLYSTGGVVKLRCED